MSAMNKRQFIPRTIERQPIYLQIQEHFKQLIRNGQLNAGDKFPTEKQLMDQFGVSRMTVSNALTQLSKEGWIYRIPGRGSFVSPSLDPVAKDDAAPDRRMVGIILPLLEDFFAIRLVRGIYSMFENSDYYVSIMLTRNSKEREKEAIQELIKSGAAGLIIFPIDAETYNEEIVLLKLNNFPLVLVDRYLPGFETNCVCSDNFTGAQLAVRHLWELGHRNIAICSDIPTSTVTVEERVNGYMESLKQKGSMINPAFIVTDCSLKNSMEGSEDSLSKLVRSGMATAYITLNLRLGMHLAGIVKKLGLKVPEDVSIVTYDNPSSGYDDSCAFTHIDQYEESIGKKSAELLLSLLGSGDRPAKPHKWIVQPSLVLGRSTAAVPESPLSRQSVE